MKIAVASDIHGHKWPEFDFVDPSRGISRRLLDCLEVIYRLVEIVEQRGIDLVVIAGDLFHKMGIIEVETFNLVFAAVQTLAHTCRVLMLSGNHDHANRAGTQHSLFPFSALGDVMVISEATAVCVDDKNLDVACIPYVDNHSELEAAMKKLKGRPLAFMHVGFKGASVGSTLEYVVKEPIDPDQAAECFGFTYSGHYHRLQFVHERVMYIGSPLEHTRSDSTQDGPNGGDPKGVLIIDTENLAAPEFVDLGLPRFIHTQRGWSLPLKNNFVDDQLSKDEDAEEVAAMLKKAGVRGAQLLPFVDEESRAAKNKKRIAVKAGMGMRDIVKKAVKKRHGKLDAERLEKLALDILREAEGR